MVDYDTSTGAVACSGCPEGSVAQIGLIRVTDRDFPVEVAVADAQYVYKALDTGRWGDQEALHCRFSGAWYRKEDLWGRRDPGHVR